MYGSANISDFAIYLKPFKLYLECKTVQGGTLPKANITENQIQGMLAESKKKGVVGGIVLWWQKFDSTVYIPIEELERVFSKEDVKSIKYSEIESIKHYEVPCKKRKVLFSYNLEELVYNAIRLKEG